MGEAGGHHPISRPESTRERVIQIATRLFASLGYDATSTRLIADAAGIDVATLAGLIGGKPDVYLAVMKRLHLLEQECLEAIKAEFTPGREGIHRLADRYLDFCVAHPEVPALWVHRWQSDASDITELENLYTRPLVERFTAMLRSAARTDDQAGLDHEYTVWHLLWCIDSFVLAGVIDEHGERQGPRNTVELQRFRTHMRRFLDRMLELDG
ncbi:TetR/AcrR family transcriptional regulator [Actinomadura scrupuli]|uniref:TetR/AcrR family transcriptional regulator n=1 Tax=Actinomadura scrupuli TaxID=559629 RepID=UPI003D967497